MPVTLEKVVAEIGELSPQDRQKLLLRLMRDFDPADENLSQEEIDRVWKAEAERRVDEIESGRVKTIPAKEVFAKLRAKYG